MAQSTAITTFLRVRPCKARETHFEPPDAENGQVEVRVPEDAAQGFVNNRRCHWKFAFNGVLDRDCSQEDVFERVAQPVIESVMSGFNGTIFAYGQTGSGKTYTLTGGAAAYAERGIIPRTLSEVFRAIEANAGEAEHTVRVSYLEIYNESGFDLLDPRQSAAAGKHGHINAAGLAELARVQGVTEDEDGTVRLKGLSSHVVASEEAAINLLFVGDTNRAVSETTMNAASSRSHCIFTVSVESRPHGSTTVRRSKLHLVDLAGSERVGKSGASGTTLNEAININSSLHFLEMVIMALHERQNKKKNADRHVPYRNSMLTSVLRDSLGGNCKTVMVATIHPAHAHTDESISTCKFAQRVAMVKNEVSLNEEIDHAALIARLKEENRALREAGGLTDEDASKRLSAEELAQLHSEVRTFLASDDPEATVAWGKGKRAARVRHALWILKGLLLEGWKPHHAPNAEAWTVGLQERATAPGGGGEGGADDPLQLTRHDPYGAGDTAVPDISEGGNEELTRRREILRRAEDVPPPNAAILARESEALRVAEHAYELFCTSYAHGQAAASKHQEARQAYREQVERAQQVHHSLRAARDAVGAAKAQVEARRVSMAVASVLPENGYEWHVDGIMRRGMEEGGAGGVPEPPSDPEETRLCGVLLVAKEKYHKLSDELKRLKSQCAALQARSETLQASCENAFRTWWPLACEEHGLLPPAHAAVGVSQADAHAAAEAAAEAVAAKAPRTLPTGQREAWGDAAQDASGGGKSGNSPKRSGAAWLALLNDPEAALAEFRANHWARDKSDARDELKRRLNEAYAGAKEAGERLGRKRNSVSELKGIISAADAAVAEGGDAGGVDVERLRAQLAQETTMYRGAVASLKELKAEIESLQEELQKSQAVLQKDFDRWHVAARAEADGSGRAGAAKQRGRGTTAKQPGSGSLRDRTNYDGTAIVDL